MRTLKAGEIYKPVRWFSTTDYVNGGYIEVQHYNFWKFVQVIHRNATTYYVFVSSPNGSSQIELHEKDAYYVFGLEEPFRPIEFRAHADIDHGDHTELVTKNLLEAKQFLKRVCAKGFIEFRKGDTGGYRSRRLEWKRAFEYDSKTGFKRWKDWRRGSELATYVRFENKPVIKSDNIDIEFKGLTKMIEPTVVVSQEYTGHFNAENRESFWQASEPDLPIDTTAITSRIVLPTVQSNHSREFIVNSDRVSIEEFLDTYLEPEGPDLPEENDSDEGYF